MSDADDPAAADRGEPSPQAPPRQDPRNPSYRLAALFDEGTSGADHRRGRLRHARRPSAGSTARRVVAFCSDATVMGGAMGDVGCKVVVDAYHRAMADGARSSGSGTPAAPGWPRACCRCTRSARSST